MSNGYLPGHWACTQDELKEILDAFAHLRYRTHKYIVTCPQCFAIEKILIDCGLAPADPKGTLPT